jgi:hypothetical protein
MSSSVAEKRDLRHAMVHGYREVNRVQLKDQRKPNTKSLEPSGFVGFGAPHPNLNCSRKQKSMWSLEHKHKSKEKVPFQKAPKDDAILKSAERLVQQILQNETVTINHETIQLAMQQNAILQSKKRYTSLLEKPWRVAVNPLVGNNNEHSESSTLNEQMTLLEVKNPKSFRRSVSSDGTMFGPRSSNSHLMSKQEINKDLFSKELPSKVRHRSPSRPPVASNKSISTPDAIELEQSKKALHEANQQILSLQQTIEAYREMEKVKRTATSIVNAADNVIDDESLSSTNIIVDDDNELVAYTVTSATLVAQTANDRPLEYIRTVSPDHRSKNFSSNNNSVSRLEYRALQIRNEQLLHTIKMYEEQIDEFVSASNDGVVDTAGRISSNLGVSAISAEQEKDIMVKIVSRLNIVDSEMSRQLKHMENKIAALNHQLTFSELKNTELAETEATSKATIEDLSKKLMECELKAKEFNENLMIQTEQRIDHANKEVEKMMEECSAVKEDAARANLARLSYETKYFQLEQTHGEVVQTFQNELNQSEAKSKRLQNEVNQLMAKSVEIIQLTTDMQELERKLQLSEAQINELRSNECTRIQAAVDDIQSQAGTRIATLEQLLIKQKSETEAAVLRLAELESAQAKEQSILSEELRDSETTIACLMEEIEALKPLLTIKSDMEQIMKDQQDEYELKQLQIAECNAALAQSECEVKELRNELQMLTSLPEIVRKMQKELNDAQRKLANQKSESKKNLNASVHKEKEGKEVKQLEVQLNEAKSRLLAKELELSKYSELQQQFIELREAYHVAVNKETEMKNQIELLRPLALDLENAERELEVTCGKLDAAEHELVLLKNQLDLLKPLTSDLDKAVNELALVRFNLAEKDQELERSQTRLTDLQSIAESFKKRSENEQTLQAQLECANGKLTELQQHLESVEYKLVEVDAQRQSETSNLSELLRLSESKVRNLQTQVQSYQELDAATQLLERLSDEAEMKNQKIEALILKVSEKDKEIEECRKLISEMESDSSQQEQRIQELTALVDALRSELQDATTKATQITLEYATIIPERDALRKRVAETSSKIDVLEKEITQKNAIIQELTANHADKAVLESLQQEHERTMERCSDLSLQLAESQYTIGQLTEQLRGNQRPAIRHPSPSSTNRSSNTGVETSRTTKSFQSILNNGIDRISSRLDDSLRGTSNLMSASFQDNNNSTRTRSRSSNVPTNRSSYGV